ncbi:hypothetical protein D3C86_1955350 [compost metagenome]
MRVERYEYRNTAAELDSGDIAVVGRLKDDHLVARVYYGADRHKQCLSSPARDGNLGHRMIFTARGFESLLRNRLPQR